jgi:hypothetical protein
VFSKVLVEKLSAERLCDSAIEPILGTHFSIVKPDGPSGGRAFDLIRDWYADVFPDLAAPVAAEAEGQILIVRCQTDPYGTAIYAAFGSYLDQRGMPWRMSKVLPQDWRPEYLAKLWASHPPRLMVMHYSCFQEGQEDDEGLLERRRDLLAFYASLTDLGVPVLFFSRAFEPSRDPGDSKYILESADAAELAGDKPRMLSYLLGDCPRIFEFPASQKIDFRKDRKFAGQFKTAVDKALAAQAACR